MKIPRHICVTGRVVVWREYHNERFGQIYCFEPEEEKNQLYSCSFSIENMAERLKKFRISSDQIKNDLGEEGSKKQLTENQYYEVIKALVRPKIFIMMLPETVDYKTKINEDGLDIKRKFSLDIDIRGGVEIHSLENLIKKLNRYGSKPNDLVLLSKTDFGHSALNEKYKYYILSSLDRIK